MCYGIWNKKNGVFIKMKTLSEIIKELQYNFVALIVMSAELNKTMKKKQNG